MLLWIEIPALIAPARNRSQAGWFKLSSHGHFSSIHLSLDPLDQALSANMDNLHVQLVNFLGHVCYQGLKTSLHPPLIWSDDISSTSLVFV